MAWTRHGHQIPETPVEEPKPKKVAQCGGPVICKECQQEIAVMDFYQSQVAKEVPVFAKVNGERKQVGTGTVINDNIEMEITDPTVIEALSMPIRPGSLSFVPDEGSYEPKHLKATNVFDQDKET